MPAPRCVDCTATRATRDCVHTRCAACCRIQGGCVRHVVLRRSNVQQQQPSQQQLLQPQQHQAAVQPAADMAPPALPAVIADAPPIVGGHAPAVQPDLTALAAAIHAALAALQGAAAQAPPLAAPVPPAAAAVVPAAAQPLPPAPVAPLFIAAPPLAPGAVLPQSVAAQPAPAQISAAQPVGPGPASHLNAFPRPLSGSGPAAVQAATDFLASVEVRPNAHNADPAARYDTSMRVGDINRMRDLYQFNSNTPPSTPPVAVRASSEFDTMCAAITPFQLGDATKPAQSAAELRKYLQHWLTTSSVLRDNPSRLSAWWQYVGQTVEYANLYGHSVANEYHWLSVEETKGGRYDPCRDGPTCLTAYTFKIQPAVVRPAAAAHPRPARQRVNRSAAPVAGKRPLDTASLADAAETSKRPRLGTCVRHPFSDHTTEQCNTLKQSTAAAAPAARVDKRGGK